MIKADLHIHSNYSDGSDEIEVLASKIAKILELESVEYSLAKIQGKRTNQIVSVCKDIVDSSEHIVSAYSLVLGYLEAQIKDYPSYIELLENELNISNANVDIQKITIGTSDNALR